MAAAEQASLEQRLRAVEDRLAIHQIIMSYPLAVDTRSLDYVSEIWTEDGVFDRGAGDPHKHSGDFDGAYAILARERPDVKLEISVMPALELHKAKLHILNFAVHPCCRRAGVGGGRWDGEGRGRRRVRGRRRDRGRDGGRRRERRGRVSMLREPYSRDWRQVHILLPAKTTHRAAWQSAPRSRPRPSWPHSGSPIHRVPI